MGILLLFPIRLRIFALPPAGGDCKNGRVNMFKTVTANPCIFATNGRSVILDLLNFERLLGHHDSENETLASDYAYGGTQFGVTSSGQWFLEI